MGWFIFHFFSHLVFYLFSPLDSVYLSSSLKNKEAKNLLLYQREKGKRNNGISPGLVAWKLVNIVQAQKTKTWARAQAHQVWKKLKLFEHDKLNMSLQVYSSVKLCKRERVNSHLFWVGDVWLYSIILYYELEVCIPELFSETRRDETGGHFLIIIPSG